MKQISKTKNIEPIKTFKQFKTLYQHDKDLWVSREKLPNTHLYSNRNSLWDAYKLSDYIASGKLTLDEINDLNFSNDTDFMPEFILVKRSHSSFKYLFYDTELDIMFNSGLTSYDVFKGVDKKWLKAHYHSKKLLR